MGNEEQVLMSITEDSTDGHALEFGSHPSVCSVNTD